MNTDTFERLEDYDREIDTLTEQIDRLTAKKDKLIQQRHQAISGETISAKNIRNNLADVLREAALKECNRQIEYFTKKKDHVMVVVCKRDCDELFELAELIEKGADIVRIRDVMWMLDTIVRDTIPDIVYNYFTKHP